MKEERFDKFNEIYRDYLNIISELMKESIDIIFNCLCETENHRIYFCDEYAQYVTVTYDGGRHPECHTNAYAVVKSVYLKDGNICVDIDEDSEYEIDRVLKSEVADIARMIVDKHYETTPIDLP